MTKAIIPSEVRNRDSLLLRSDSVFRGKDINSLQDNHALDA